MLLVVSGSQWGALRSYAWISMTLDYSQQMGLFQAASKAVGGSDPCQVCLFLSSAKGVESESEFFGLKDRFDLRNEYDSIQLFPVRLSTGSATLTVPTSSYPQPPLIPPPREV
jgi:hypothetical protein